MVPQSRPPQKLHTGKNKAGEQRAFVAEKPFQGRAKATKGSAAIVHGLPYLPSTMTLDQRVQRIGQFAQFANVLAS